MTEATRSQVEVRGRQALEPTEIRSFSKLFIGGEWAEPTSEALLAVVSPSTEQLIAEVPAAQNADVDLAVAAARVAFDTGPWPRLTASARGAHLLRLRDEIAIRVGEMAASFSAEIGAPMALATAFHEGALGLVVSAAELHERFSFEEQRDWEAGRTVQILHEPVGVVATIIPWNVPVSTCLAKICPALAAGCTTVVKSAEEGPVSMMLLAEAIEAAGLPPGVVNVLPGDRQAGEHLVTHPDVDKITFTGSTAAGKRIMGLCAERVRNVTLELGGKSAAIIADEIPLDDVLPTLVPAGILHSGQICAALTRVLVPRERQDELVDGLRAAIAGWKVGDPLDPETALGPLVSERQRDRVETYIRVGQEEGARLVIGGGRPIDLDRGWYVEPTVFADVDNGARIAREEIFGPVIAVIPFDSLEQAVQMANDSVYGLSGAVFALDAEMADRLARRVRTGQIGINTWDTCGVQPFGGYKQSGLGREGGIEGLRSYTETKVMMSDGVA